MSLRRVQFILVAAAAVALAQQPGPYPTGPNPAGPNQGGYQGPYQGPPQDQAAQQEPVDQPGQPVARLGVMNGDVSVRRGDSGEWVAAAMNAPLLAGDSLAVGPNGSAEIQIDYADYVRIGGDSEIRISQLDGGRNQVQVSKGLVTWRVLRDSSAQSELSTPALAVHPLRLAEVRVEVAPDGSTRIIVRKGDAEVSTPRGTERIHDGNMMLVRGTPDDPEYQVVSASVRDGWDNWNDQRDSYLERAQSNRYVSQDIQGAEDLDQYGRWGYDAQYGNVWTPNVPANWAPYQNGQWTWEDSYGWTWVDSDPWGWAPFHYGSWYFRTGYGWSWFPGARYGHYWWHPAMVGFFGFGGGVGVGFGFGNIGWVPLAPFEAFHPWYGRGWYGGGRFGVFNNVRNVNIVNTFRNARIGNGVSAVTAADFQRGAFRNRVEVGRGQLEQASLVRGTVPVAPTASNLRFSERGVSSAAIPRANTNQRFFSRMPAAGAQRTPFTQQQAAARSAFGGGSAFGGREFGGQAQAPRAEAPSSGWRRFGEPTPAAGNSFQRGGTQPGAESRGSVSPNQQRPASGWGRFGTPQAAPQQQQQQQRFAQPARQAPSGRPSYEPRSQAPQARSLQVSPQMVQPRQAPSGGGYRGGGAPQGGGNRGGGGGGGHASSGGHGRR
ncbi:MAG TPA: DUF6600 domain-containing protein [Bryobacteraceae bacterium]|jgi:hypothetical protein|nr:DUF6600 domain-containing protein [Bryobacteraceae bacterium]